MKTSSKSMVGALSVVGLLLLASACATDPDPAEETEATGETEQAASFCWPPGRKCNDGNACTKNDRCTLFGRCAGTTYSCNDGNGCTNDACDGNGGCTHVNNTAACNDGNPCTKNDRCANGSCNGTAYSCDDGNGCTNDSCDGNGGCNRVNNTNACNDGNACTTNDHCSNGTCSGTLTGSGGAEICDDGIDNDCDGAIDAADSDCTPVGCPDPTKVECINCQADFCPSGYECGADSRCHPTCNDGVWNGDEGDKDCGGACSAKCTTGQHCWTNWDCAPALCVNDHCQ